LAQSPLNFAENIAASPLQQLTSPLLDNAKVRLFVKRDDLIHPQFGGNKWRKLKYNLIQAKNNNVDTLLTFGGAWSNHIYATAAAGRHFGFKTIGLIRGEKHQPLNPTLSFAKECGMQLHYLDRKQYRQKNDASFKNELLDRFGEVYLLPEGGSNRLALKGCEEIVHETMTQLQQPFDVICCASGTGATLAGLVSAMATDKNAHKKMAIGFSALKGGEFLSSEVSNLLGYNAEDNLPSTNWRIENNYHFGGYAKINDDLIHFMKDFQAQYNITLDAVYTAKMFYGLFELIKANTFKPGSNIVAVHSGGLQGNKGFNLQGLL
jgi:1-aminocyclopropane-1-carboxylate deaminase/D-cysteine desulfhydrase-like pyridoxal-dependent ACC family enzyme